jgi:hypothetical protein
VLAVVADDVISILAKPAAGTQNHILAVEARIRVCAYGDWPAASKFPQRYFFHRSAAQGSAEPRVMDDPTVTHVEAMMNVTAARGDEMRSQWRLFSLP